MTRVPIADIVPSPSLQEALAVPQIAHMKKKVNVQRKDLVFTFVQDKELQGEFFVMLVTPAPQAGSSDTPGGFAALPSPKAQAMEKKMIPVLDIKVIDSMDNLTFSIVLHDECQMNSYDVAEQSVVK